MKKVFTLFVIMALTVSSFAQTPEKMSYQAVIRNSSGQLVTSHAVGMQISILQGSATGTPIYVETQNTTTNANGLASIEIGGGTPVTGTFVSIDWSAGSYYIKTETDPTGGINYTITGTSQILSVPYSLYAQSSASSIDAVKLTGDQTISGNKTFTGITTVLNPVNPTDAVNKTYIDNIIKASGLVPDNFAGIISDIDDNIYKTVKIRNQVWMMGNLKTTKYNDGTPILRISGTGIWGSSMSGAYCWYDNDSTKYEKDYGKLYNWHAVNTNKLCPIGWHVPSIDEWYTLFEPWEPDPEDILIDLIIGEELMETGTNHWNEPLGTNETGFTALPGGARNHGDLFYGIRAGGYYWSSNGSAHDENYGDARYQPIPKSSSWPSSPMQSLRPINEGLSIRCMKN